ncbi:ketopantoate reductase family protein [Paraglaciecola sp. 2405UD69-4]|uniref:ketopantoate reductase family protein n=1 Tax=Paraglaciecola sp. 2405UD69-4 TaxID=3391836 RepID=UPI0039C8D43E
MSKAKPKIAIVGKGAIGSLIAYKCQNQNIEYQLLLKNKLDITLEIENINGRKTVIHPKNSAITSATNFDIIVLPIKAYQVLGALKQLRHKIQPNHTLVLLHNGMGTIEQVKLLYPNNPIIAATTSYGAFKTTDTSVKETGLGETHLGWVTSPVSNRNVIEETLSMLLPPSVWHETIQLALWKKLAINSAINPLTAIHNVKNGVLAEAPYTEILINICSEVSQVLHAEGFNISPEALLNDVNKVLNTTANNYSSMHQDVYYKRQTEVEFINGYVSNKGKQHGISTPANRYLYEEILKLESAY